MQKTISKFIYFFIAATLIIIGLIVKFFLVDTNLGANLKSFNHRLLASDLLFGYSIFLGIIGSIFYAIKKSRKTTLKDSTIIVSAILIFPITLVLALTPILETIYPGEVGDSHSTLVSWVMGVTILGTFTAIAWIILFVFTIIKQTIRILTIKKER